MDHRRIRRERRSLVITGETRIGSADRLVKHLLFGLLAVLVLFIAVLGVLELRVRASALELQTGPIDFSKFRHDNANHARLPCLLCHRRESNAARPAMPGGSSHVPCTGCHAQEFANSASPVCAICHTDSKTGALKPFPRLASFGVRFDHTRHLSMGQVGCSTCHRPTQRGVALSIPNGFAAHTTCYGCHTGRAQSNDRDISSCGTCHVLGGKRIASQSATAFRVGFSHQKHDRTQGLSCTECHKVRSGGDQVTAPQALNHHASANAFSCRSCHDGKRAFGGDDFSVCKRCHTGNTWRF
jgi:c(7)-type cytochrome triheme protein